MAQVAHESSHLVGLGCGRAFFDYPCSLITRALLKPLALEGLVDLAFRCVVVVAVRESRFEQIKARFVSREDLRVVCRCESFAAHVLDRFLT